MGCTYFHRNRERDAYEEELRQKNEELRQKASEIEYVVNWRLAATPALTHANLQAAGWQD